VDPVDEPDVVALTEVRTVVDVVPLLVVSVLVEVEEARELATDDSNEEIALEMAPACAETATTAVARTTIDLYMLIDVD